MSHGFPDRTRDGRGVVPGFLPGATGDAAAPAGRAQAQQRQGVALPATGPGRMVRASGPRQVRRLMVKRIALSVILALTFVLPAGSQTMKAGTVGVAPTTCGAGTAVVTIPADGSPVSCAPFGSGISGLTTGVIPKAGSATTIVNGPLDDGVTVASTVTTTEPINIGAQNVEQSAIANEGVTGTTLHKLVQRTGAPSTWTIAATSSTLAAGVCNAACGTTGTPMIVEFGSASCIFDNATTAGDYVGVSTTVAGDCHDLGATFPTNGAEVLGIINTTNGAAGTFAVDFNPPDLTLPNAGGGGGGGKLSGTGANTNVAFWTGTHTLSADSNFNWDSTNHRLCVGVAVGSCSAGDGGSPGSLVLQQSGTGGGGPNLTLKNSSGTNREGYIEMGDSTMAHGFKIGTDFNHNNGSDLLWISDAAANTLRLLMDTSGGFAITASVGQTLNLSSSPFYVNGSTGQTTICCWSSVSNPGFVVTNSAGNQGAIQLADFKTTGTASAGRVFFENTANGTSLYIGPGQVAGHLTFSRDSDGHSMLNMDSSGHVAAGDLGNDASQPSTYTYAFGVGNGSSTPQNFGVTGAGLVGAVRGIATVGGTGVATSFGNVSLTAQTASIATATLCAAASCSVAGQYNIDFYLDSTVACATPGLAAVSVALTWTDEVGTKSAQALPLDVNGATSLTASMTLGDTTSNAVGHASVWSTGVNAIQYATTLTACTTGTATYAIRAVVTQIQ